MSLSSNCNGQYFWALYQGQLIIYPKATNGSTLEITGPLKPAKYTVEDLKKEMVSAVSDSDTEVQGLSDYQLKLVRYRVLSRMLEDVGNFEGADRFESKALRIEHEMRKSHNDENFTDSSGVMGPGNV